jgi:hypothetical protein
MGKAALVTADFTTGLELVGALDRAGLPISVALWLFLAEYEGCDSPSPRDV